jgi:hypothetical protein
MNLFWLLASFIIGPFRNINNLDCTSNIFREELVKQNEILKDNVKNVTFTVKRNIENKLEESAIEKLKSLNNQLEWIRNNLNNE